MKCEQLLGRRLNLAESLIPSNNKSRRRLRNSPYGAQPTWRLSLLTGTGRFSVRWR